VPPIGAQWTLLAMIAGSHADARAAAGTGNRSRHFVDDLVPRRSMTFPPEAKKDRVPRNAIAFQAKGATSKALMIDRAKRGKPRRAPHGR